MNASSNLDLRLISDDVIQQALAEQLAANFYETLQAERREAEADDEPHGWRWPDTHNALLAACEAGVDLQKVFPPWHEAWKVPVIASALKAKRPRTAPGQALGQTQKGEGEKGSSREPGWATVGFLAAPHLSCDCDYGADGTLRMINVRLERKTFRIDKARLGELMSRSAGGGGAAQGGAADSPMITIRVELGRGAKATYRVPRSAVK